MEDLRGREEECLPGQQPDESLAFMVCIPRIQGKPAWRASPRWWIA